MTWLACISDYVRGHVHKIGHNYNGTVFMQSRETQITMVKWTNAGGQTKRANERSFVYRPPAWRRWRNVKTTLIAAGLSNRVLMYVGHLHINNHRSSGFRSNHWSLVRQCYFVWSEIAGPHLPAYIFNNIHTCWEPEVVSQKQKDAFPFQSLQGCPTHWKGGNIWSNFASVGNDNFIADEWVEPRWSMVCTC